MTKEESYAETVQAVHALIDDEPDLIAAMSTAAFVVKDRFPHFNWVGFYRRVDEATLKVGPYQGGLGCLTIDIHRGVCGQCVREKAMQLYNDVHAAPDHIACDTATRAEIVFPILDRDGRFRAVFDIDSISPGCFDETDVRHLQEIADLLSRKLQ